MPVAISWLWVDQSYLYPASLSAKRRAAITISNEWYVTAWDLTHVLPFPGVETLPIELPGSVKLNVK